MKTIHFLKLSIPDLALLALFTVLGCKTPAPVVKEVVKEVEVQVPVEVQVEVQVEVPVASPPDTMMPLTPSILQRLRGAGDIIDMNDRIGMYQFRLLGRIILEREYTESNDGMLERGTAKFENTHIRENILINDQTDGQAMLVRTTRNETILYLCFEDDDKYQLVFYAENSNPDGYFYLDYTPNTDTGDEKGTLLYGGETYKLKYSDRKPYILIRLTQRDIDRLSTREATGRRVN